MEIFDRDMNAEQTKGCSGCSTRVTPRGGKAASDPYADKDRQTVRSHFQLPLISPMELPQPSSQSVSKA